MKIIKKIYNRFLKKYNDILNKYLSKRRLKRLKYKNFNIISNNCWGGKVYQFFGLRYNSPTIGLFFSFDDYVKFCSNLKYYIKIEPIQIKWFESHNLNLILKKFEKKKENLIIGKIDDVEIFFLHYKTFEIAKDKWLRRCKRIDFNLPFIFKCNDTNGFKLSEYYKWEDLKLDNKIFTTIHNIDGSNVYHLKHKLDNDEGVDDTTFVYRDFDLINLINNFKE